MAKKDKDSVYKVVEVIGTSTKSWADAGRKAVETAAGTLRELRIAEVVKLDMAIEDGKVRAYRARGDVFQVRKLKAFAYLFGLTSSLPARSCLNRYPSGMGAPA
jgi:flavin-binding protein dodecin